MTIIELLIVQISTLSLYVSNLLLFWCSVFTTSFQVEVGETQLTDYPYRGEFSSKPSLTELIS